MVVCFKSTTTEHNRTNRRGQVENSSAVKVCDGSEMSRGNDKLLLVLAVRGQSRSNGCR